VAELAFVAALARILEEERARLADAQRMALGAHRRQRELAQAWRGRHCGCRRLASGACGGRAGVVLRVCGTLLADCGSFFRRASCVTSDSLVHGRFNLHCGQRTRACVQWSCTAGQGGQVHLLRNGVLGCWCAQEASEARLGEQHRPPRVACAQAGRFCTQQHPGGGGAGGHEDARRRRQSSNSPYVGLCRNARLAGHCGNREGCRAGVRASPKLLA